MIRLLLTVLFSLFAFLMHAQRSPVYTIQGELKALSVSDRVAVKLDATLDDQKVYAEFREDIERKDLKIVQRGSTLKIRLQEQKEFRKKRKKRSQNAPLVTLYLSQQNIVDYTVESLANLVLEGRSKTDALRINVRGMGAVTGDFTAKEAKVVLESMGEITGRMVAQKLEVTVGEMGKASWTGDVELLDAEVNSMGVLDGKELKAKFVKMHIEEMGKAEVYPVQSLEVQIESMGKVTYYHTPERIEQTVSSMGSLHKKEGND